MSYAVIQIQTLIRGNPPVVTVARYFDREVDAREYLNNLYESSSNHRDWGDRLHNSFTDRSLSVQLVQLTVAPGYPSDHRMD